MWRTTVETGNRSTERVFKGGSANDRCCVFSVCFALRAGGLEGEGFVILTLPNGRRELTTFLDSQTFKLLCVVWPPRVDSCVNYVPSVVTAYSGFGTPRNDDWVYDMQLSMVL